MKLDERRKKERERERVRERRLGGRRRRWNRKAMSERGAVTSARRKGKSQIGIHCHLRSWS